MFEQIERVPGDAILGLIEAFKKDTNPQKVDLGVGVYRDAAGNTPVMRAVKEAEARLLKNETTKTYIGSHGARLRWRIRQTSSPKPDFAAETAI